MDPPAIKSRQELQDAAANPAKQKKMRKSTQADHSLVAIQAGIDLRSGYNHFRVGASDYRSLLQKLKKVLDAYTRANKEIRFKIQDPGYASLCSRPSQRLFQEHLLPEGEGWAHRLEPDPIRQVEDSLEALLISAAKAQEQLKQ